MEKMRNLLNLETESANAYKERASQEATVEQEEDSAEIDINEMLGYELIKDDEVWLHVSDVRNLSFVKKLELLRNGLSAFASILKSDESLKNVNKISAMSWIVSKNPKLLVSLGFEVADSLDGLEDQVAEYDSRKDTRVVHIDDVPGYAFIDKEKFVSLYGSSSDQRAA